MTSLQDQSSGHRDDGAQTEAAPQHLVRGMGLVQATSVNMLQMLGIGPFITMGIIFGAMGGPQAMLGWLLGAFVSICDGLSCAELAAAMPGAGGAYVYLREAYNRETWGRLVSFLFIFETVITAPLSISAACVGFAEYIRYTIPRLSTMDVKLIAMAACIFAVAFLFRPVSTVGKLSVGILSIVIAAILWIIIAGFIHINVKMAFAFPPGAFHPSPNFFFGMAAATLFALYNYGGYNAVAYLGGEIRNPSRNIPRAIVLSIVVVAVLYIAMSVAILGVVPWREAAASHSIAADFIGKLYGRGAGDLLTVLILIAALGSIFMMLLGYSRVLYAAGKEGTFLRVFARLHPKGKFPTVSLLVLAGISIPLCWLPIDKLIASMMVIQIVFQFIPSNIAVFVVRRHRKHIHLPFKMWLYPLPVIIAILGWAYVASTPDQRVYIGWAGIIFLAGLGAYLLRSRSANDWPFLRRS